MIRARSLCTTSVITALIGIGVTSPVGASGAGSPTGKATVLDGPFTNVSIRYAASMSENDHCRFTTPYGPPGMSHCAPNISSQGGVGDFTSAFSGTVTGNVAINNTNSLKTPASGTGMGVETVTTLSASGTYQGGWAITSPCGWFSGNSSESYAGSTTPAPMSVDALTATRDSTGGLRDLALNWSAPADIREKISTVANITAVNPETDPQCAAQLGTYRNTFDEIFGSSALLYALAQLPQTPNGEEPMSGFTINPNGNWTPETGGVLAQKEVDSQASWPAPDNGPISVKQVFQVVTAPCAGPLCQPTAVAGTYNVVRAQTVLLNGNKSKPSPGAKIIAYNWTLAPGPGCPAITLTKTRFTSTGPTLGPFTALCSLKVSLKVTDSHRRSASDTKGRVAVRVRGKPFLPLRLKNGLFTSTPDDLGADTKDLPQGNGTYDGHLWGRNVINCRPNPFPNLNLCPQGSGKINYRTGGGYSLKTVADPITGPFQHFAYVSDVKLIVALKGITNKEFSPDGAIPSGADENLNSYNRAHNAGQYSAFLLAVHEHENMGTVTNPLLGHSGAALHAIETTPADDVRTVIEPLIAPTDPKLQETVNNSLYDADVDILNKSSDYHLGNIGNYLVYLWKPIPTAPVATGYWAPYRCDLGAHAFCFEIRG
jgi:hypothetical protein